MEGEVFGTGTTGVTGAGVETDPNMVAEQERARQQQFQEEVRKEAAAEVERLLPEVARHTTKQIQDQEKVKEMKEDLESRDEGDKERVFSDF